MEYPRNSPTFDWIDAGIVSREQLDDELFGAEASEMVLDAAIQPDELVWRSVSVPAMGYGDPGAWPAYGVDTLSEASLFLPQPCHPDQPAAKRLTAVAGGVRAVRQPPQPQEFLTADAFDMVLSFLPPHPDLFHAMRVCRAWRLAAAANYARRELRVPALPDALLAAAKAASPGDTIRLDAGVHTLSRELTVDVPLRLLGPAGTQEEGPAGKQLDGPADTMPAERAGCGGEGLSEVLPELPPESERRTGGCAVIASQSSAVLVRTRAAARIAGVTLCRLGEASGYPNAAIFAEAASLSLDCVRVTCAADGTGVDDALCNFEATRLPTDETKGDRDRSLDPLYAVPAKARPMPRAPLPAAAPSVPRPLCGLWVGASASVELRRSVISCTHGPAIKVNRGAVDAEGCDIAFSRLGANIVANGGSVRLARSHVRSARGEGISAWNNARISLLHNSICDNEGNGLAFNSAGPPSSAAIEMIGNTIAGNSRSGVMLNAAVQSAVIQANTFARNGSGSVGGARIEQGRSCRGRVAPSSMPSMPRPAPLVRAFS